MPFSFSYDCAHCVMLSDTRLLNKLLNINAFSDRGVTPLFEGESPLRIYCVLHHFKLAHCVRPCFGLAYRVTTKTTFFAVSIYKHKEDKTYTFWHAHAQAQSYL